MVSTKTSSWRQRLPATRTQSGDRFMDTGVGGWWNLTQEQYPNYWMHHLPPNLRHSVPPSDCSLSLCHSLSLSLAGLTRQAVRHRGTIDILFRTELSGPLSSTCALHGDGLDFGGQRFDTKNSGEKALARLCSSAPSHTKV